MRAKTMTIVIKTYSYCNDLLIVLVLILTFIVARAQTFLLSANETFGLDLSVISESVSFFHPRI